MKMILALAMLWLSACGFTPVYGPAGHGATGILDQITIAPVPDRSGQALRNALMDRFYTRGMPQNPEYILVIAPLVESIRDMDITADDEATRRSLRLSTTITLNRVGEEQPVLNRGVYALVSYNVLQSQFTTRVAEQNARDNGVLELARQIEHIIVTTARP